MAPIPIEYLLGCSERILGEYQLSRLNRFSILKKQARVLNEQAIDCAVEAAFALWLREHRKELLELSMSRKEMGFLDVPREERE